jgi:hypothetical protein
VSADLDCIDSLDELARLAAGRIDLFVRWSRSPELDQETGLSFDELTGVELPGLSANALAIEAWWRDRPLKLWLARRLYDYRHLREMRSPDVRPWVLSGAIVGRGPDNEPLVRCHEPLAWLGDRAIAEATDLIEAQPSEWGSLNRS